MLMPEVSPGGGGGGGGGGLGAAGIVYYDVGQSIIGCGGVY